MGLEALIVATYLAAGGTSGVVQIVSILGGLSGIAALVSAFASWRSGARKANVDDKTVAITEIETAIPGMGAIIEQWQAIVKQLQSDLANCRQRVIELEEKKQRDDS